MTPTGLEQLDVTSNKINGLGNLAPQGAAKPGAVAADHRVTPADIAAWEPPEAKVTTRTPRVGREKEWYELTGKVVLVKAEEDGDLHIHLGDPRGRGRLEVVVEVPVDHGHPDSAWSNIRKTVFDWSSQEFPISSWPGTPGRLPIASSVCPHR